MNNINFGIQGQVIEGNNHIWHKFELIWDFMHELIICMFDEDRIKSK